MEFLNKQYGQLRDLVLGMSPGNRITIIMLGILLVVSLGFLVIGSFKSDGEFTYVGNGRLFNGSQQLAVDSALNKAGLTAYSWEGMKLKVPRKQVNKYAAVIFDAKAVTELGDQLDKTINGMGVYEPGKMMDKKILIANGQELSAIISSWPWVESATVLPDSRLERDPKIFHTKQVRSASVSIKPIGGDPITDEQVSSISLLVAGSLGITDLKEIKIVDARNQQAWFGNDHKARGVAKTYEETQREYEVTWNKKIREHFPDIRGLQVTTTVELYKSLRREQHTVEHGPAISVATRDRSTDFKSTERDIIARPGLTPQGGLPVPGTNAGIIAGGHKEEKTEENETQKALSGTESRDQIAPLTPQFITASIRIPISYIRQIWSERHQEMTEPTLAELDTLSTEIIQEVRNSVGQLLKPHQPKDIIDIAQMVTVTTYNDPKPLTVIPPTFSEQLREWLAQHWQTLAMLGLVGTGVLALWNMTRIRKADPIVIYEAPALSTDLLESTDADDEEEDMAMARNLEPFDKSIRSLQHEVTELVTENPDAAVNILRQWIGNLAVQES